MHLSLDDLHRVDLSYVLTNYGARMRELEAYGKALGMKDEKLGKIARAPKLPEHFRRHFNNE